MTQQTQTRENLQKPEKKLQDIIGRPLLWMACRKHVGEVHVGKVYDILKVEVNVSTDVLVFKRFREDFSKIAHGTALRKLFDINSIKPEHQKFFTTQNDIVISTLKKAQKKRA